MKVGLLLATLITTVLAAPQPPYRYPGYDFNQDYYAPAYYSYGYAVKDPYYNTDFGQEESRNGDNTKGQYQVLLPDGRRQVVTYYVNGNSGFVADVKYIGEAKYPVKKPVNISPYREY